MATPSHNPPMNLPPATPLPLPPSSSSPPPALTAAHDQSAAASENQDQRPLLPSSSASGDTVVTVEEEKDGEQRREEEDGEQRREEAKRIEEWVKKMQGWLVVLATLVASVTYSAGLNVPGGFWQDDSPANITEGGHTAGNPVLADKSPIRYRIFIAFNTSAFLTSMVVIVLVLERNYFHSEFSLSLLLVFLIASLISLTGAYCAGSTRHLVGVLGIVFGLFVFVFGNLLLLWRARIIKRKSSTTRPVEPRDEC